MFANVLLAVQIGWAIDPDDPQIVALPAGGDAPNDLFIHEVAGGRVVVAEDHRVEVVEVAFTFPIGTTLDAWHEANLDYLWPMLVLPDLDGAEDPRFSAWAGRYACGVTFAVPTSGLSGALAALRTGLIAPFAERAGHLHRPTARRLWREQLASPDFLLDQLIARAYYAEADPRRREFELPKLAKVSGADLYEVRNRILATRGWVASFAGDVSPADAEGAVRKTLEGTSALRENAAGMASSSAAAPLRASKVEIYASARTASEVLVGFARPGLALSDRDAATAILADAVVQRRIARLTRQTLGHSYSFSTDGLLATEPDVYVMRAPTAVERAEVQARAILDELARVAERGFPPEEVERVRLARRLERLRESHDPGERTRLWTRDFIRSLRGANAGDLELRALEASVQQVSDFARVFYDPASYSQFAVGPESWVRSRRQAQRDPTPVPTPTAAPDPTGG